MTVAWPQKAQADAKALLIRTARNGHASIMQEQTARKGVAPSFHAYANQPGRPIEQVVLPGPIIYNYDYRREVAYVGLDELKRIGVSPVDSGAYRARHGLYLDGERVLFLPEIIPPRSVIMLANDVPYARRLEIGKTKSGRDFVVQVPNRIYERVAKNFLIPRYRNVGKITFGYVTLPKAHVIKGGLASHYAIGEGRRRKRRQKVGTQVRAPAIFIEALT